MATNFTASFSSPRGRRLAGRPLVALVLGLATACASSRVDSAERILQSTWAWPENHRSEGIASADRAPRGRQSPSERPAAPSDAASSAWTIDAILEQIAWANPTLGAARARLEEAEALRREAIAAYFPELSLGLDYLSTDNPAQAFAVLLNQEKLTLGPSFDPTPGSTDNWRKEIRLDWPLFAPGRDESRLAAREAEEGARLASEAVERRLLNAGVQSWLGLDAARDLENVAWESIAVVERRLEQTRKRHREGAALRADVLRLEVRLASARQEAARATLVARQAESSLNHLMGRPPDALLPLADEDVVIGSTLVDQLEALLAEAEAERRDLLAAAHRVRMTGFQREGARAERLPLLQAFAAYDIDGPELSLDGDLDSYTLGIGLRFPFSARTGARIRQAQARERLASGELRELVLSVAHEVRDSWEGLRVASETLVLAEAAVGAAEEAFRIVAEAQDAGGATVTDVLEAEDSRKNARVRHVAAKASVQIARAQLVAAIGGVR